jgi:hypothetical protein
MPRYRKCRNVHLILHVRDIPKFYSLYKYGHVEPTSFFKSVIVTISSSLILFDGHTIIRSTTKVTGC